jgi:hypothetical protein
VLEDPLLCGLANLPIEPSPELASPICTKIMLGASPSRFMDEIVTVDEQSSRNGKSNL